MNYTNRIAKFLPKEEPPEDCYECKAPGVKWEVGKHSSAHKHGCSRHYPCVDSCPCKLCGGTQGQHFSDRGGLCDDDPRNRKRRKKK